MKRKLWVFTLKKQNFCGKSSLEFYKNLKDQDKIDVCTINPSFVLGPSLSDDMGASNLLIRGLLVGKLPALAKLQFNVVNVVDVAKHIS